MIINTDRKPELSLYYVGGIVLSILKENPVLNIEELLEKSRSKIDEQMHIDFLYYALDWLYLLSIITIQEGMIYYDNKKVNSTKDVSL